MQPLQLDVIENHLPRSIEVAKLVQEILPSNLTFMYMLNKKMNDEIANMLVSIDTIDRLIDWQAEFDNNAIFQSMLLTLVNNDATNALVKLESIIRMAKINSICKNVAIAKIQRISSF